jgi:serpin B
MATKTILILLAGVLMFNLQAFGAEQSDAERGKLVAGNNRFALELYGKLKNEKSNVFVSPYSISTALAMVYAGARGETAASMEKVLHFDDSPDRFHPEFAKLIGAIRQSGASNGNELNIANALWVRIGEELLKSYLDLTRRYYGAGVREVDFAHAAEQARITINTWVEEQTKGKIKDLIKPGLLNAAVPLVLTNAIYFKGAWASKFNPGVTRDAPFHTGDGESLDVPMMSQTAKFAYAKQDGMQILELPYAGGKLSMVMLLPEQSDGLAALEKKLSHENLARWIGGVSLQEVIVQIPRFKMTFETQLNKALEGLGLTHFFSNADFSGMNGKGGLFVGQVIHKAFVDVKEEGTEAAGATAVIMLESSALRPNPKPVFRADHPFVFLIRDVATKSILFVGRMEKPTAS